MDLKLNINLAIENIRVKVLKDLLKDRRSSPDLIQASSLQVFLKQWQYGRVRDEVCVEMLATCLEAGLAVDTMLDHKQSLLNYASGFDQSGAVVATILAFNPFVDHKDAYGCTALHCAVAGGNDRVLQRLLTAGCDPLIKSDNGLTCFDLCYEKLAEGVKAPDLIKIVDCLKVLIDYSPNTLVQTKCGPQPLKRAAAHLGLLELLT